MERRLAAILAADVQGYSHLTELDEESSTATLRSYSAVVEEAIAAHRGHSLSWAGDGVGAEFPSVVEAIRCAAEIQDEIAERNTDLPEDQRMQFRIGVNLGDVIAEGDRLYGTGVNVAVRLQQLAEPGGIFVSQTVYDQVRKIAHMGSAGSIAAVHLAGGIPMRTGGRKAGRLTSADAVDMHPVRTLRQRHALHDQTEPARCLADRCGSPRRAGGVQ